jgi:tetratricopeptide (TPR) repeat protein
MANIFQPKARHVVPTFRGFADTVSSKELLPTGLVAPAPLAFDAAALIEAWETSKTLGTAGDLLGGALVSGHVELPGVRDAATFVLERSTEAPTVLVAVSRQLLGKDSARAAVPLPRLAGFVESHSRQALHRAIAENRRSAARFPRNPIIYVENARLYSIVGNQERAMKNMRTALSLAPFNRFVLRCAARLYAHYREEDRALHLLRTNPRTSRDPWLASAELALAGMVGEESGLVRRDLALASSDVHSPASLSELSSGLASALLLAGDRRKSRSLFRAALVQPNDNSLAQVEWAFSQDRLFDVDVASFGVERNYEALARDAFSRAEWLAVLTHCESWFMDMPFTRGPVVMGAHVASVVLDDYDAAILFCKAGLVSHPSDQLLQNNLAYALALAGRVDEAATILDGVTLGAEVGETTRISIGATRGLVAFRRGLVDVGRALYHDAIDAAGRTTVEGLPQLAWLNYVREEVIAGVAEQESLKRDVRRLKIDPRQVTLVLFRDKIMAMLEEVSGSEHRA